MVYQYESLTPTQGTVYVYGINLISSRNNSGVEKFYLYNAHGDVVQLVDGTGAVVKEYRYDAFGVEYDIDENDTNYFRYTGQYFDFESGTYYLRARYYNPANGRFTQQDGWGFGNPYDPLSLNLYIYCRHNPVMYYDPSGHDTEESIRQQINSRIDYLTGEPDWASSYTSEAWDRMINELISTGKYSNFELEDVIKLLESPAPTAVLAPALEVIEEVEAVINNTDEQKVLEAEFIEWYKGQLVIKLPIGGNAASFGVMIIGNDVKDIETVQHEYGHTVQFRELGVIKYTASVAIPSVSCNILSRLGKLPYYYYSYPWEYQADIYGGVNPNSRKYDSWSGTVNDIYYVVTRLIPF